MKIFLTLLSALMASFAFSQPSSLKGQFQSPEGEAIIYANVALFNEADSVLVKVEPTNESGIFLFKSVNPGKYFLAANYLGMAPFTISGLAVESGKTLDLGVLTFIAAATELAEATITATRAMVEVHPDRTVFNVDGTINAIGSDGLSLLRKAPGVTVDNNDNINVLGRAGVIVYVDGKRLPLAGQDLSIYLQNLTAAQIDRIDIISNPGARYEAEGNAGIIDIKLKKDKNLGANGSLNGSFGQGRNAHYNLNGMANYRNRKANLYGNAGYNGGRRFMDMDFYSYQNGLYLKETDHSTRDVNSYDGRVGADFFLSPKSTLGLLIGGGYATLDGYRFDRIDLGQQQAPIVIDSILIAESDEKNPRVNQAYNLNYRFDNKNNQSLNIDLDYGLFRNDRDRTQPNRYWTPDLKTILSLSNLFFQTPTDIDIMTAKVDYTRNLLGGALELGSKVSRVVSDNTFLYFEEGIRDDRRSNMFKYDENVYAGYFSYGRAVSSKVNISAGLRAEQTDARGDLTTFLPELEEPPVKLNYLSWFPSAGLTWQVGPKHNLAFNYGRRINRPDYNVLNPFNNPVSQLSFERGNPNLRPEIVNNLEVGYTLNYRYNFKLAWSKTIDQITRLIAPDETDPRANFINWDNLAKQTIWNFTASLPIDINPWWSAYFNGGASYIDNQADYGDGAVVDVQAFNYTFFQQQSFKLPWALTAEVSGYYSGPGIWGGVFLYDPSWSLDLGLQRKFLGDRLNVRLSVSDIFYESFWSGYSDFNGLNTNGKGGWDARRVTVNAGYRFGNDQVKSRERKTGLGDEAKRVGE